MKKFFTLLLLFLAVVTTFSQTVKVKKEKYTVKGESLEGFSVELEGTLEEVNTSFNKMAKTLGKVKKSESLTINEPKLNGVTFQAPLVGKTTANSRTTTAWLGFDKDKFPKDDFAKVNKELENVMKDFGVKFYKDKIQLQIDETIAATQAVEKQKQKLLNENKSLVTKTDDNKREKTQLLKSLEQNRLDSISLVTKLALNKKAQDSVGIAADQIKKVLELQKEKQRKID